MLRENETRIVMASLRTRTVASVVKAGSTGTSIVIGVHTCDAARDVDEELGASLISDASARVYRGPAQAVGQYHAKHVGGVHGKRDVIASK